MQCTAAPLRMEFGSNGSKHSPLLQLGLKSISGRVLTRGSCARSWFIRVKTEHQIERRSCDSARFHAAPAASPLLAISFTSWHGDERISCEIVRSYEAARVFDYHARNCASSSGIYLCIPRLLILIHMESTYSNQAIQIPNTLYSQIKPRLSLTKLQGVLVRSLQEVIFKLCESF